MSGLVSPVNAPRSSACMVWAPTATLRPPTRAAHRLEPDGRRADHRGHRRQPSAAVGDCAAPARPPPAASAGSSSSSRRRPAFASLVLLPGELDEPPQPMVHRRSADAEGRGERRRGRRRACGAASWRSRATWVTGAQGCPRARADRWPPAGDRRRGPFARGSPPPRSAAGSAGIARPRPTICVSSSSTPRFAPIRPEQGDDLLLALDVDDVLAAALRRGPLARPSPRGARASVVGGVGRAQDELDVRARGRERDRSRAEQRRRAGTSGGRRREHRPSATRRAGVTVDPHGQVVARPRAAASRRRSAPRGPSTPMRKRGGEVDGRARGRVIERPQPIAAAAVEQADELGAAAACPRGLDACELALDLAGEEHLAAQEAVAAGRRTRRWRGRSTRSSCWSRISAAASLAGSCRCAFVGSMTSSSTITTGSSSRRRTSTSTGFAAPPLGPARVAAAVDDDAVDEVVADVGEQRAQVLRGRHVGRLARLGGDVADVDLQARARPRARPARR